MQCTGLILFLFPIHNFFCFTHMQTMPCLHYQNNTTTMLFHPLFHSLHFSAQQLLLLIKRIRIITSYCSRKSLCKLSTLYIKFQELIQIIRALFWIDISGFSWRKHYVSSKFIGEYRLCRVLKDVNVERNVRQVTLYRSPDTRVIVCTPVQWYWREWINVVWKGRLLNSGWVLHSCL